MSWESPEIRLFYRNLSSRKRGHPLSVFRRHYPKYSNDQRGKLDYNWLCFCLKLCGKKTQDYAPLQRRATNNLTNSHNFEYWIEITYSDFSCHLKVKRDKLALINRRWKCKKGKGSRLRLVHSRKLTNMTISPVPFPAVTVTVVPDRAKNQSDCRIAYSALLGKNKRIYFGAVFFSTEVRWSFAL